MPSKKIVTDIKFKAQSSTDGTIFDFIGVAWHSDKNHRILNIPVNLTLVSLKPPINYHLKLFSHKRIN